MTFLIPKISATQIKDTIVSNAIDPQRVCIIDLLFALLAGSSWGVLRLHGRKSRESRSLSAILPPHVPRNATFGL